MKASELPILVETQGPERDDILAANVTGYVRCGAKERWSNVLRDPSHHQ